LCHLSGALSKSSVALECVDLLSKGGHLEDLVALKDMDQGFRLDWASAKPDEIRDRDIVVDRLCSLATKNNTTEVGPAALKVLHYYMGGGNATFHHPSNRLVTWVVSALSTEGLSLAAIHVASILLGEKVGTMDQCFLERLEATGSTTESVYMLLMNAARGLVKRDILIELIVQWDLRKPQTLSRTDAMACVTMFTHTLSQDTNDYPILKKAKKLADEIRAMHPETFPTKYVYLPACYVFCVCTILSIYLHSYYIYSLGSFYQVIEYCHRLEPVFLESSLKDKSISNRKFHGRALEDALNNYVPKSLG
jgi:hypothetical protein